MRVGIVCALALSLSGSVLLGQAAQTPAAFFGYTLGEDARVPSWRQIVEYHEHLAQTSNRVRMEIVGRTVENRPLILVTVSSPANLARIDDIQRIQRRLADPRTVAPGELDDLVARGRPVSLIFTVEPDQTGAWLSQIVFVQSPVGDVSLERGDRLARQDRSCSS